MTQLPKLRLNYPYSPTGEAFVRTVTCHFAERCISMLPTLRLYQTHSILNLRRGNVFITVNSSNLETGQSLTYRSTCNLLATAPRVFVGGNSVRSHLGTVHVILESEIYSRLNLTSYLKSCRSRCSVTAVPWDGAFSQVNVDCHPVADGTTVNREGEKRKSHAPSVSCEICANSTAPARCTHESDRKTVGKQ